jgi:hypothetical protein
MSDLNFDIVWTTGQWSKLYINKVYLGLFEQEMRMWRFRPIVGTCDREWPTRQAAESYVIAAYKRNNH